MGGLLVDVGCLSEWVHVDRVRVEVRVHASEFGEGFGHLFVFYD